MNTTWNSLSNNLSMPEVSILKGSNPLRAIVIVGQTLIVVAQILYVVFFGIFIAGALLGNLNAWVFGNSIENPVGPTLETISLIIVPAVLAFIGVLVSIGATLSIYIPLVPYVIFSFGAIAWLTSTIEAMVAGPLVALGVLSPSGQHELMGKSEPALMLIFGIFLRPSLMIFGLISAMLLANVVVAMINAGFWNIMIQTKGFSPLQLILFLVAYVTIIFSALNKCFAVIYLIPQRVMDWIGAPGVIKGGEEEGAAGEMKSGVAGGAAGAGSASKPAMDLGAAKGRGKLTQQDAAAKKTEGLTAAGKKIKPTPPTP